MNKQTLSLTLAFLLGLAAIFNQQVTDGDLPIPPLLKPYVAFGIVFFGTTLVPSVKKWEGLD